MGVVNPVWSAGSHGHQSCIHGQQPQYGWSLSPLPSLASSKSALSDPHGGQVGAPWNVLADQPAPSSATSLTGAVDLSLLRASAGTSPTKGPPRIVGGQFARGVDRAVNLVPSSSAWHQVTDDGVAEGPPRIVSDSDGSIFATTAVEAGRSEAASSISYLGSIHGFSSVSSNNTARSPATPASSGKESTRANRGLHYLVHHDDAALRDLVQIFFTEIHPYWPLLHVPTFVTEMASDMLLGSMLMLSSWVIGRQEHLKLAPIVFGEVSCAIGPVSLVVISQRLTWGFVANPRSHESAPSLHSLQALLLCVVYAICCRVRDHSSLRPGPGR
ncbi:hypothetical protein VTI74DRAFT_6580 [Chaetomium olivicolor]